VVNTAYDNTVIISFKNSYLAITGAINIPNSKLKVK